jgi:hypothetical protein
MAQTAWVTMTRGEAERQPPSTARPRVDAGVKELSEMTIGRTDDPENPFGAQAFRNRLSVWDWIAEPIWASGHEPREQAAHMIAVDPPVKLLIFPLASEGPSTHAPTQGSAVVAIAIWICATCRW